LLIAPLITIIIKGLKKPAAHRHRCRDKGGRATLTAVII